jgi:hypothetical protein
MAHPKNSLSITIKVRQKISRQSLMKRGISTQAGPTKVVEDNVFIDDINKVTKYLCEEL